MIWAVAFAAVALAFVWVTGVNDGAALLGLSGRYPRSSGPLLLALVLVPLVLVPQWTVAVARTFTEGLTDLGDRRGALAFLLGVTVALAVVAALSRRGLPTSLTLAIVGGIGGAGLGMGLDVSWRGLALVLAIGAAAPLVGTSVGYALGLASRRIPSFTGMPGAVRTAHVLAYSAQCAAYAANDGQKMLAVVSVARHVVSTRRLGAIGPVQPTPVVLIAIAVVFCAGALSAVHRVGERLGRGLVLARPLHVVSTEAAAAASVAASSIAGAPVSMTQSVTAGVVGVAASEGAARVRWQNVLGIGAAWVFTLPLAFAGGVLGGLAVRTL
ncbi:inorganic phosphate transporter [Actinomadura bangladeshensis]|uniref:Inorganic phosphate transporter n=1 Tax=Actinomadura bangladeshensis TaxID=453573 RepID=A0A4R4PEC2_9ACTN|nr:inorganic phosphate transporter [Actinomadura bangladeshensis]TDC20000.1 inorganic phosphate transporter [Actinomadura bangladeshensis]